MNFPVAFRETPAIGACATGRAPLLHAAESFGCCAHGAACARSPCSSAVDGEARVWLRDGAPAMEVRKRSDTVSSGVRSRTGHGSPQGSDVLTADVAVVVVRAG